MRTKTAIATSPPFRAALAMACALAWSGVAAHGGGLNAEGCHNNRKTGDYHCHRAAAPAPKAALASPRSYGSGVAPLVPVTRANAAPRQTATYANCSEARAAGAAPVRYGDAGYGSHLDRDGDGVGCE
jgi:hypothetical protein